MLGMSIGKLFAELGLKTDSFDAGLNKANNSLQSMGGKISSFVNRDLNVMAAGMKALPFAAVVGGAYKMASSMGDLAEGLGNLSATTGLTREQLQELKFVADQGGFSFDGLANSSTILQRKLMGVEQDSGDAAKVMKALGIEVHNSDGSLRSMSDLFPAVISRLQSMTNETQRNMYATQIFGRNLGDVAPLLSMSADNMQALVKQAHDLGVVLDERTLKSMDELDTALDALKATSESAWKAIQTAALPTLNALATEVLGLAHELGIAESAYRSFWKTITKSSIESAWPVKTEVLKQLQGQIDLRERQRANLLRNLKEVPGLFTKAQIDKALAGLDTKIADARAAFNKAMNKEWDKPAPAPVLPPSSGRGGGGRRSGGGGAVSKSNPIADALASMERQIRAAVVMENILGESFDLNAAKASAFSGAIQRLAEIATPAARRELEKLAPKLKAINEQIEAGKRSGEYSGIWGVLFGGSRQQMASYFSQLEDSIDRVSTQMEQAMPDTPSFDEGGRGNVWTTLPGRAMSGWAEILEQLEETPSMPTFGESNRGNVWTALSGRAMSRWTQGLQEAKAAADRTGTSLDAFLKDLNTGLRDLPSQFLDNMTSSLEAFALAALHGKASFQDFGNSVLESLMQIAAQWAAGRIFGSLGRGLKGTGFFGDILGGIGDLFGLAEGGIIRTPGPVLVGERGPEILNLPRGAQVAPLSAGAPNITISVNTGPVNNIGDIERIGDSLARTVSRRLTLARG